jgi:DNA-directed RNA polymerase subunit RPC12/RpoP
MYNLKCPTCGSNHLKKLDDYYQCEYCGTTLIKPQNSTGKKRLTVILVLVIFIVLGIFMGYHMLYSVQESIEEIKTVKVQKQEEPTKYNISIPLDNEKNPFEETFKEVEQQYGSTVDITDTLYTTLKSYHKKSQHKALYLALSSKGDFAIGMASGEHSIQQAEDKAYSLCEEEKSKHKNLTVECLPYAIDEHISSEIY